MRSLAQRGQLYAQAKLARTEAHHVYPEILQTLQTMPHFHKSQYTPLMKKCVGMLNTEISINLANTFNHTRDLAHHNQVMLPAKDLNQLVGSFLTKDAPQRYTNKQVEKS